MDWDIKSKLRKYWPHSIIMVVGLLIGMAVAPEPDGGVTAADINFYVPKSQYQTLEGKYNALQFTYGSLKKAFDESKDWHGQYNGLVDDVRVAQTEKAVLQGQLQSLTAQYQAALNALSGNQAGNLEELEAMNRRLQEQMDWNRTINEQVELVRAKKVQLLSDNLTDAEYNAFYKGWELWWGTFNDTD